MLFKFQRLTSAHSQVLTVILGSLSLLSYVILAQRSQHYGDLQLNLFLATSTFCALACFVVWWVHHQLQQQISLVVLIGFAIAFRIAGLFTFPILEDDFYRYLWDAKQTWQFGSPYGPSPSDYFDTSLSARFETILDNINYPNVATVYGPSAQWLFAFAYLIAPGEIWPLQWIFTAFDLCLIFILLKLTKPNSVLLYAWSPLIIKEFCITAHPDIVGAFFIVAGLLLHKNKRYLWAASALALAAGIKIFALLILPFFIQFYWRSWLAFFTTAIIIALPFGIQQAWLPSGLSAMSSDWLFNAPIYLLLGQWLSSQTIKLILLSILALFCIVQFLSYFQQRHSLSLVDGLKGEQLYGLLFLCAPVFNPWYLVWLLPFAVIRPRLWIWTLSLTVLLSYASGINLPSIKLEPYAHPTWVILLEFSPVLIAMLLTMFLNNKKAKKNES